jgi:FkbM family methyltransferase
MNILKKVYNSLFNKKIRHYNFPTIDYNRIAKTEKYGDNYNDWVFCPSYINSKSKILSFGVGENLSFEYDLNKQYSCNIDVFDFTPKSIKWFQESCESPSICLHKYGISNIDGFLEFMPPDNPNHVSHTAVKGVYKTNPVRYPVFKLSTILDKLGNSSIDILKLDIEGCEYAVIEDLIHSGIHPAQILVEYHHRFPGIPFESTQKSVEQLKHYGYRVFHVTASSQEISFINADLL